MSGTVGPRIPPFINTYSLDFDGVSDKLLFSSSNWGADSFSISMWINPSVLSGYRMLLGGSGYSVGTGLGHYIFGNTVKTWVSTGGFAQNLFTTSTVLSIGTWCHIVLVRNKNVSWDLYINGILTKQSYIRLTEDYTSDESLIARHYNNNSFNYGGKIDEVSIFNYGLLPTEVSDIYNLGTPKNLTSLNPITWFRMGDNGAYKDPQWLIPSNENKDKVSNYSLSFDGMDDYVEIGTQSLGITGAISISAWVKIPISGGWGAPHVEEIVGEDGTSGINWTLIFRPPPFFNYFSFTVYHTNGTSTTLISSGVTPNDGQWHHLLATSDGTTNANGVKLYVDGILNVQATATSIGTKSTPTVIPTIGSTSNNSWFFEGNIDEVSIWDNVVSIGNVWDGSGKPIDITPTNPFAWWKMGENATFVYNVNPDGTWIIPDEVGSNDGTSNNLMADSARVGNAPSSSNNALSFNMDLIDRVEDTPPNP